MPSALIPQPLTRRGEGPSRESQAVESLNMSTAALALWNLLSPRIPGNRNLLSNFRWHLAFFRNCRPDYIWYWQLGFHVARPRILCDSTNNPSLEPVCGRPLGLTFNRRTGELFVADSPRGLVAVSPDGSNATLLASSAGGVQFRFLNGVDIDQNSEVVYFTDTSAIFTVRSAFKKQHKPSMDFRLFYYITSRWIDNNLWAFVRSQVFSVIITRDRTGRLLSYDPRTKEVRVLQRGLAGPEGVAVSRDGSFLLFSEIVTNTIQRFWLRGPRANTTELVARVEGLPDGIRRNARGEFWVATTVNALSLAPRPVGLRFSEQGVLLQNVTFNITTPGLILSQVEEFNGQLYLGLTTQRFVGRANLIPPAA